MIKDFTFLIRLMSAGNFAIGMGAFVIIGILNPLAEDFGLTHDQAGWVLTIYAIAYALGSPVIISLTGTWSRRTALALGIGVFGLASILSALAPNPEWLFATRVLAAFGAGMYTPAAAAVAAANSPPEMRGKSLATIFFGLTLAQVIGVPGGSFIAYTLGWTSAFWIVAILSLTCTVLIWLKVPTELDFAPSEIKDLVKSLLDWRGLLVVAFTATLMAALYVPYTYMAPLLAETMDYGRDGLTLVLLVFGCGAVVGNWIGGNLADRIGSGRTLAIVAVSQTLLMPLFSLLPMPGWALLVLVFFWSVLGWSFMPPQQSRLVVYGQSRQGVFLALNASAIYIGASIGSAVGGLVILGLGLQALGVMGGLMAVVALTSLWLSERLIYGNQPD